MKISKFFLVNVFVIVLVILILFGVFLTLDDIKMFFDELKLINENLSTDLAGLFVIIVAVFIFKDFILED